MNPENNIVPSNKLAVIHVLAGLINDPLLFMNDNYKFDKEDFPERFHQIVFGAIEHLAFKGMEKISYLDIDQLLKNYPLQYTVFTNNKGIEYIQHCLELYDPKKFDYYYHSLRKYSLLNQALQQGIDISELYDPDIIDPVKSAALQEKFDKMSENDILLWMENKVILLKERFGSNTDRVEKHAGDGLRELVERLKRTPDMGLPCLSPNLTTVLRGFRPGALVVESAPSGTGKSRRANGEACHLSIPEYYDVERKMWVKTGFDRPTLIIETELEEFECQQMWLAFVSGVSEAKIKDGRYTPEEEERINKAIELISNSKMYFVALTNYDIEDVVNTIKKYKQLYNIEIVFFDYLMETLKISASLNGKIRGQGLRTDQVLLMFTSALKDLAKTLGIFIWTATQLSGDYKNATQLDAGYLRSAKSIADKVDAGYILMPVREQDANVVSQYCAKGFELAPNFVFNIYKVRAGSFQNIKLYFNFDRSTCQVHDCFATDNNGTLLHIDPANVESILDDNREEPDKDKASVFVEGDY